MALNVSWFGEAHHDTPLFVSRRKEAELCQVRKDIAPVRKNVARITNSVTPKPLPVNDPAYRAGQNKK
jgi:hypothetical protein